MKKLIFCILLLTVPAATALMAQQSAQPAVAPTQGNFVPDDDGGLTEIVPANFQGTSRQSSALPVMKSVQQVSIFLGAAWGDQQVRSRQTGLLDLAARGNQPALTDLQGRKVEMLPAANKVEDLSDFSKTTINDLTIQHKLAEMLESKVIPLPAASTVYVIFLAPGINSTLGQSKAVADYAAYHNLIHLEAGEVRYVVVPYHNSADSHSAAAARALVDTVFNPTATTPN
ncbi:MAG TPA: hypothetical protein VKT33_04180 [Candidatus Angelobacter sp.]|nr:hypothetical protein [Candidatus Angelobacter sp.]